MGAHERSNSAQSSRERTAGQRENTRLELTIGPDTARPPGKRGSVDKIATPLGEAIANFPLPARTALPRDAQKKHLQSQQPAMAASRTHTLASRTPRCTSHQPRTQHTDTPSHMKHIVGRRSFASGDLISHSPEQQQHTSTGAHPCQRPSTPPEYWGPSEVAPPLNFTESARL